MTVFDETTRVTVTAPESGHMTAELSPAWASLRGIHGGYLNALAIKAALLIVGERAIRTVATTFLRPAGVGLVDLAVEPIRRGKTLTNVAVTISQASRPIVISRVTASMAEGERWDTTVDLALPPIEQCEPIAPPPHVRHFDHGEAVLDPASLPFSHGPLARVGGYLRPREARPIDAAWLGMALDWFPPAAFSRTDPPVGGVSIDYTIHIHRTLDSLGDDEWLQASFRADISAGGIALEKGLIADRGGHVLAESFHTRLTAVSVAADTVQ
jgi:acyl-CoA thioesterase